MHQLTAFLGQVQIALFGKFKHASLGQFVQTTLTDEAFLAEILPEEEVDDDANDRNEAQYHNPSNRLCRLPIVHQYGYHGQYNSGNIERYYDPMNVKHLLEANHFVGLKA